MSQYRKDRFRGFGISAGALMQNALTTAPAPETQSQVSARTAQLLTAMMPTQLLDPVANIPAPQKTEQQKAEDELARIRAELTQAEQAAAVELAADPGAPSSSWLLYAGLGVGALALVGGALFLTRRKKGKVSGYRRRRRRR